MSLRHILYHYINFVVICLHDYYIEIITLLNNSVADIKKIPLNIIILYLLWQTKYIHLFKLTIYFQFYCPQKLQWFLSKYQFFSPLYILEHLIVTVYCSILHEIHVICSTRVDIWSFHAVPKNMTEVGHVFVHMDGMWKEKNSKRIFSFSFQNLIHVEYCVSKKWY